MQWSGTLDEKKHLYALEHFAYLRSCKTEDFIGSGLEFVEFRSAWPIRGDELDHDLADAAGDDSLLAYRQPRRRLVERD